MRYLEAERISHTHTHTLTGTHTNEQNAFKTGKIQNFGCLSKFPVTLNESKCRSPQQKMMTGSTDLEESFHFGRAEAEAFLDARISLEE